VPGWIPGAPVKDDVPVCGRCGHHASAHPHATSCSVRGRWWRRGYLRSPQDQATRQALLAELEKLEDQTARADAYGNFRSVLVRYQVPRSWVTGATCDTSTAEDVPSAEFKAQVALVKAAKNAIRDTTAEAQSALQRANDELAEVRRHEAGG